MATKRKVVKNEIETIQENTIHGFTSMQIAAMFKYGMNENHPMYAQAAEMIQQFLELEHQATIERLGKMCPQYGQDD